MLETQDVAAVRGEKVEEVDEAVASCFNNLDVNAAEPVKSKSDESASGQETSVRD